MGVVVHTVGVVYLLVVLKMSAYSSVRGGKLKLKSGAVGGHKKKKRKREHSKHDDEGEYKHAGKPRQANLLEPLIIMCSRANTQHDGRVVIC